ncbi:alpha/beta hydrolase [Maritalea porphyrae]|uniref:alpha/beta hydrolase n=1 Tax=Maritalea porphyrae TaxID=880732 RepID=UPI0022AF09C8|nr:alpha/beta hydrolase [Maritalea porphyrae]MCZ4273254.1 alpha/beta hydrolase [Maritalea porphyrae]
MKQPVISDWDDAYSNGAYIEGADEFPPRWAALAAQYRDEMSASGQAEIDLAYGKSERERLDLFLPTSAPKGLAVFVHGGYWMAFDKSTWSHLAKGAVDNGWAVAMPSYTLAPEAHLTRMSDQIAHAIEFCAQRVAGPIRLSGHSAGGHLVTRQICEKSPLKTSVQKRIEKVVSISGLHDLRPLMKTKMNEKLVLDEDEALDQSAALQRPVKYADLMCWVGGNERPEFLRQNKLLAQIWSGFGVLTEWHEEPSKHHFNVIDDLADKNSELVQQFAP